MQAWITTGFAIVLKVLALRYYITLYVYILKTSYTILFSETFVSDNQRRRLLKRNNSVCGWYMSQWPLILYVLARRCIQLFYGISSAFANLAFFLSVFCFPFHPFLLILIRNIVFCVSIIGNVLYSIFCDTYDIYRWFYGSLIPILLLKFNNKIYSLKVNIFYRLEFWCVIDSGWSGYCFIFLNSFNTRIESCFLIITSSHPFFLLILTVLFCWLNIG